MEQRLSGNELVEKIVKGSPTIDLLRNRVNVVTKTIVGIFNQVNPLFIFGTDFLSSQKTTTCLGIYPESNPGGLYDVEWLIVARKESKNRKITIHWSLEAYPGSIPRSMVIPPYSTDAKRMYPGLYIQILHESLPAFMEKVTKQFPFLIHSLEPVIEAADYAKKNGW